MRHHCQTPIHPPFKISKSSDLRYLYHQFLTVQIFIYPACEFKDTPPHTHFNQHLIKMGFGAGLKHGHSDYFYLKG
jgi:hypothetical protein